MNELRIIKVSELRAKLSAIPGKLILSVLLLAGINYLLAGRPADPQEILTYVQERPLVEALGFVAIYGACSYLYFFIRLMHHALFGIVAGIALVWAAVKFSPMMSDPQKLGVAAVMLLGGPVMDLWHFLRYRSLRRRVIEESRQAPEWYNGGDYEDGYGEGYDNGYGSGYDSGYERGRAAGREQEQRRMEDAYRTGARSFLEDDYEDDYEEEPRPRREALPDPGGFFRGCRDEASVKRRYRELCKVYHPDSGNGSEEIFVEIQEQYQEALATF